MTQTATVKRIISTKRAEITVRRPSACGHKCSDCTGCKTCVNAELTALAENALGAVPGDVVTVESSTAQVLGIAAVVYLVPLILFFALYFLGGAMNMSESIKLLLALAGLAAGVGAAMQLNRAKRKKTVPLRIVSVRRS